MWLPIGCEYDRPELLASRSRMCMKLLWSLISWWCETGSFGLASLTLSAGANGDLAGMTLKEYNTTNYLLKFNQIAPAHTFNISNVKSSINHLNLKNAAATTIQNQCILQNRMPLFPVPCTQQPKIYLKLDLNL